MELLRLLFLLLVLNGANQLNAMSRKAGFTMSIGATALGVGSLAWQVYTKDYSLKKSLVTRAFLGSGLAGFLYNKFAQGNYLQQLGNNMRVVHPLVENVSKPDEEDLYSLIGSNNYDEIKRLLEAGIINPNEKVFRGNLIFQALSSSKFSIFNLLIERGAEVMPSDLCLSIRSGDNFFDLIVDRFDYAQIGFGDKAMFYHKAAIEGTPHMLEKLRTLARVHIDVLDKFGYTPLLNAVIGKNSATVKFLLTQGANHKIVTNSGRTLEDCTRDSDKKIRKIIKEFLTRKHFVESDSLFAALPHELTSIVLDYVVNNVN